MNALHWLALALPLAIIAVMGPMFRELTARWGPVRGDLAAFALYLVLFCGAAPLALLGPGALVHLLELAPRPLGTSPGVTLALLGWPLIAPLLFEFGPALHRLTPESLVLSLLLALAVGLGDELLWRGVYLSLFAGPLTALVWPSLAFAVWHLAPLSVRPNRLPGGSTTYVAYAFVLGLSYALAALRCGSLLPVVLAHALHDFLGLPGVDLLPRRHRHPAPLRRAARVP